MSKKLKKVYVQKGAEGEEQKFGDQYDRKQSRKDDRSKPITLPERYNIPKSDEEGFTDIETCMDDFRYIDQPYEQNDDGYFDTYSHFHIHEEMLKDRTRTLAYMDAITKNPEIMKDKIVLDIGCGTGILSIFAARAGAKHVYAIDAAGIATHAKKIVEENGFQDKITVIRGMAEDVTLPVDKVDIIVSEWMGYFLLYESMLNTVLYCRDKWLAPDGILMPDRATIYIAGIEDESYKKKKVGFWDDVYGVSMKPIQLWSLLEPLVDSVDREQLNTNACAVVDLDLKTMKPEEVEFANQWSLEVRRKDKIHALVAWFDVFFSHGSVPVRLTTSPMTKTTHWMHTVFYLNDVLTVDKGDVITGSMAVKKSVKYPREQDVKVSYRIDNKHQKLDKIQFYSLK